jgi:hypothetical protein
MLFVKLAKQLQIGCQNKMSGTLVGIGGKYGAGKDVVANFYKYELGFVAMGSSDILNDMMMVLDPYVMKEGSGRDLLRYSQVVKSLGYVKAKENPEVRRLLQVFGTEIGRQMIHQDLWVDLTAERIQKNIDAGKSVVLTGVRYQNEVDMVHRLGGYSLWITRPGFEQTGSHASENSLTEDDFNYLLINDSTIGALETKAGELYMEEFSNA